VEGQRDPDPEFPTVKVPNPEEGESAFALSKTTADKNNSTIILANDPDADRLGVAEKQSKR
jgi:phosphoglucomutase/phosphopentomutase